eukprot:Clim_evm30s211 gene=Clim_evmTU30s211
MQSVQTKQDSEQWEQSGLIFEMVFGPSMAHVVCRLCHNDIWYRPVYALCPKCFQNIDGEEPFEEFNLKIIYAVEGCGLYEATLTPALAERIMGCNVRDALQLFKEVDHSKETLSELINGQPVELSLKIDPDTYSNIVTDMRFVLYDGTLKDLLTFTFET